VTPTLVTPLSRYTVHLFTVLSLLLYTATANFKLKAVEVSLTRLSHSVPRAVSYNQSLQPDYLISDSFARLIDGDDGYGEVSQTNAGNVVDQLRRLLTAAS